MKMAGLQQRTAMFKNFKSFEKGRIYVTVCILEKGCRQDDDSSETGSDGWMDSNAQ
jgi:hypothetical protein